MGIVQRLLLSNFYPKDIFLFLNFILLISHVFSLEFYENYVQVRLEFFAKYNYINNIVL